MKITLVSPTPLDIFAPGVRILSSYMKKHGHKTRVIFLPGNLLKLRFEKEHVYHYPKDTLEEIVGLCRDSDLIGISFMTQYFDRAVQLTKFIKESLPLPVIWGGIHSTIKPEESIKYADMICIGEGEEPLLELAEKMENGKDPYSVRNIWFKKNGDVIRNDVRPLIQDLDHLPFFDYDLDDHYIYDIEARHIIKMDNAMLEKSLPTGLGLGNKMQRAYRTMTDRGCPHKCAYCAVGMIKDMYASQRYLRRRSVRHSIEEIVQIKNRFPFVQLIQFFDDTFFARPLNEIEEFSVAYKEKVHLPFHCQGSPTTITEEKLKLLIDAGLVFVEMGIQSGSEKTQRIYNRMIPNKVILKAASTLNRYKSSLLSPCYHIILDNPWETKEDVKKTLDLVLDLPRPFWLKIASLTFYPQTMLYRKAKEENLIKDEFRDIYRKPFCFSKGSYLNYLIYLAGFNWFPRAVLRMLSNDWFVKLMERERLRGFYFTLYRFSDLLHKTGKGIRTILRGDTFRLSLYVHRFKNYCLNLGRTSADV
jgi:anaerobic magnesium-protoporphyrin IX monomethyl ester cyclase